MTLIPFSRYKIIGHSMLPTLKPGQETLSFNWAYLFSKPKVGDIMVARVNGKEVVKRIQKLDGDQIFVAGDNKDDSLDSNRFGSIDISTLLGKIIWFG